MGMSLDFDVDLEKGDVVVVDCINQSFITLSPDGEEETIGCIENNKRRSSDRKEKRKKSSSSSSASKPPRPPRGPSLDAADQKLIREIAELAMLKRARIERLRALKKSRASKADSSAASSVGNVFATLFTAIFFFVLILQGLSPKPASSSGKSPLLVDAGKANGGFGSVQLAGNPTASEPDGSYTGPVLAQRLSKYVVSGLKNKKRVFHSEV